MQKSIPIFDPRPNRPAPKQERFREAFQKNVTFVTFEVPNVTISKKMLKIHFRPNGAFFVKKMFFKVWGGQPLILCP